jgi:diguanylate cyclase (GGDEF)-like protein
MNIQQISEKVNNIGESTFAKLKELAIPLYPKYYHETFMDILGEEEDPSLIDLTKKHPNLFASELKDMEKVLNLDLAKESLEAFAKSNENLKNISDANVVDITSIRKDYENIRTQEVLDVFDLFQNKVIDELTKADETITKLKVEIERLERESHIDPLTKAFNRRVLIQDLEELLHPKHENNNLYVVMFDADDFKNINDSYGHIAGDKTLIFLAKLLQNNFAPNMKIYRFGGEEFITLFQNADFEYVKDCVQNILNETNHSKLLYKGHNIHLTLSAGIAKAQAGESVDALLEKADNALYQAKDSGKNCLKVHKV